MEKPENIKKIDLNYILEYCKEKGSEDVDWLVDLGESIVPPDKNGNDRRISFIEIRKAFCQKYMPELLPIPKAKQPNMYERINALR